MPISETAHPSVDLDEAARQLAPAAHDAQVACDSISPADLAWAHTNAIISRAEAGRAGGSVARGGGGDWALEYFPGHVRGGTTLAELVCVAGTRWAIEEEQGPKNETGRDHYQVRRHRRPR